MPDRDTRKAADDEGEEASKETSELRSWVPCSGAAVERGSSAHARIVALLELEMRRAQTSVGVGFGRRSRGPSERNREVAKSLLREELRRDLVMP